MQILANMFNRIWHTSPQSSVNQVFQMVDIQENGVNKPIFIYQTMTSWFQKKQKKHTGLNITGDSTYSERPVRKRNVFLDRVSNLHFRGNFPNQTAKLEEI